MPVGAMGSNDFFGQLGHSPTRKKELFNDYLQQYGIVDGVLQGLQKLYDEPNQPEDPLKFLKEHINTQDCAKNTGPCPFRPSTGTCKSEVRPCA
jgi:hypothetical protein